MKNLYTFEDISIPKDISILPICMSFASIPRAQTGKLKASFAIFMIKKRERLYLGLFIDLAILAVAGFVMSKCLFKTTPFRV